MTYFVCCLCSATACMCWLQRFYVSKSVGTSSWRDRKADRVKSERAMESARIAAELEPRMLEPQVVGCVPVCRPIRGATPRRFAFYQGLA